MNPLDPAQYAAQVSRQHQPRRGTHPQQPPGELLTGQGGMGFSMASNQPQPGEVNLMLGQPSHGQPTFNAAGGNTMGTYQFNPQPTHGTDPASSNALFATSDPMSMQQFSQNRGLYHSAEHFNLEATYEPSTFAHSIDPMTTFQQNYSGSANFQGSDMAFALAYEASAAAQPQSMDMLLPDSTYVPFTQSSMQPSSTTAQIRQQDWTADMSNFNLSLSGQIQDIPPDHSSENPLAVLPQCTNSSRSQSTPSYPTPHPAKNTFIPPGKSLSPMMARLNFI